MKFEHIKSFADLADLVGDMVLANEITLRNLQIVNGDLKAGESVYQFYIISCPDILLKFTDELVFYDDELCLYIWGIKHFGTSWELLPPPEFHE